MKRRERIWRWERRVPLAFIAALLLQAASAVWWASAKDTQDRYQDGRIALAESALQRQDDTRLALAERLARIEARVEHQTEILKNIERRLGK